VHAHAATYSKLNDLISIYIYIVIDNERTAFDGLNSKYTNSWSFCLCVSLERLATLVLSIPEAVVERRTSVHPVHAFTYIGCDCVGCFVGTWKDDCLGSSSCGQRCGALPLHQVTQRQFIKFADPTRRSGHNILLHVLHSISYGIKASVSSVGLFLFLVG
jgi:hypothetical protein